MPRNGQNRTLKLGLRIPCSTLPTPILPTCLKGTVKMDCESLMAGEETVKTPMDEKWDDLSIKKVK